MHSYFRRAAAVIAALSIVGTAPTVALAGSGSLDASGMTLNVNYRFPPNASQLAKTERDFRLASRILCDATEGHVKIKQVNITVGSQNEEAADVWILDDATDPRSFVPGYAHKDQAGNYTNATGFSKGGGFHVNLFYSDMQAQGGSVIAHELIHYAFAISDEYAQPNRDGTPCGEGAGMNDGKPPTNPGEDGLAFAFDETHHTLGQSAPRPKCQTNSGGTWTSTFTFCDQDADCNAGERCYVELGSEFIVSEQYFDLEHGASVANDCPAPLATTVFPAGTGTVYLNDTATIDTQDLSTLDYADAAAAAANVPRFSARSKASNFAQEFLR